MLDDDKLENIAFEVSRKLKPNDVLMALDELPRIRGALRDARSGIGSEFMANMIREWCTEDGINTLYIEPGAPWQNGGVERFNSRLRYELMLSEIFTRFAEVHLL